MAFEPIPLGTGVHRPGDPASAAPATKPDGSPFTHRDAYGRINAGMASVEATQAAHASKLAGVAAGATANATDAQLRDRATHTGVQAASTISDFNQAALNATSAAMAALSARVAALEGGAAAAPDTAAIFAAPGGSASVWRTPVPAGATYAAASPFPAGTVLGISAWDGLYLSRSLATASDPLVNLLYADTWSPVNNQTWKRSGNTAAVETNIRAAASNKFFGGGAAGARNRFYYHTNVPGGYGLPPSPTFQPVEDPAGTAARQIRVPANRPLLADFDTDGHMTFFQPDGTVVETYSTIVMANGDIVAASYAIFRADGLLDHTYGGMTASMIPVTAGTITNAEVNAQASVSPTGGAIPHALAMLVPEAHLQRAASYPASTWDRNDVNYGTAASTFPMGSRLAIPRSVNLASRTYDTHMGAAIAQAAQNYGIFVGDRGGGACALRTEHPGSAAARGLAYPYPAIGDALFNDTNWVLGQLRVVTA